MAIDLRKYYVMDESLENEGIWETLPNGSKVKVARVGNDAFIKEYNALPPETQAQIEDDSDDISEDVAREVFADLLSKTILVDWDEVYIDDEKVPYDQDLAKELLRDIKDFRNDVWRIANNRNKFRQKERERSVKKQKQGSSGSSGTAKS